MYRQRQIIQIFLPKLCCPFISVFKKPEKFFQISICITVQITCTAQRVKASSFPTITQFSALRHNRHMSDLTALETVSLINGIVNDHRAANTIAQANIKCILHLTVYPCFHIARSIGIMYDSGWIWNIFCNLRPCFSCKTKRQPISYRFTVIGNQARNRYSYTQKLIVRNCRLLFNLLYRSSYLLQISIVI